MNGTEGFGAAEFERLRRATETYREELVVTLGGRVGLRLGEMARIRPTDLERREYDGQEHHFLVVRDGDGESRDAYVPPEVARDLRKFVNANGVGDEEPIFDVTPRRLQMVLAGVAERAADGEADELADVSARDLRKFFARRLLGEEDVDPTVVQAVGGWKHLGGLEPYVEPPTDREVAAALGEDSTAERAASAERGGFRERYVDCVLSLGSALDEVSTRAAVEATTCETLASVVSAAWVCDEQGELRAWAGTDEATARATVRDAVRHTAVLDERGVHAEVGFVQRALDTDAWAAGRTLAVVPLQANGTVHGLLCVVPERGASDDALRRFLVDAGRRVGWTVAAVERKRLLLADTAVELTFEVDGGSIFADASAALDCRFDLEGLVPVESESLLYFVTASGASAQELLDYAREAPAVDDVRLIRDDGETAQLEVVVSERSPATILVQRGGTVEALVAEDGTATLTGVFSNTVDVRSVVEDVTAAFPGANLRAKRETERTARTTAGVRQTLEEDLTEKQRSVLRAAYFAGYFEWPRGSTAEELADAMDVSSPTLHNHLRKAQQKVLTEVFEESA